MALLTKEQILNADDLETEIIEVPEWGGEVKISVMPGHVRDRYEESCIGKNGGANLKNIRAKMAAFSIVDDEGKPMFTEAEINKLGLRSGIALVRVYDAVQRLNKITDEDIEELAKN